MAGLWRYGSEKPEGKYLVARRDGTVPKWPCIVLGARDEAAEHALIAYAEKAEKLGYDPDFISDIRRLAEEFNTYRKEHGNGDPDAPHYRKDVPGIVAMMKLGKSA